MTDELPPEFARLTPRPAPAELRSRVLAAAERELAVVAVPRGRRWQRAIELGVAACLALGVGLNIWQWRTEEAWQARIYGPATMPRSFAEVSEAVALITDAETAQSVVAGLLVAKASPPSREPANNRQYEQLLRDLTRSLTGTVL